MFRTNFGLYSKIFNRSYFIPSHTLPSLYLSYFIPLSNFLTQFVNLRTEKFWLNLVATDWVYSIPLKMTHFSFKFVSTKITHLKWKHIYLYFIPSIFLYSFHLTDKIKLYKISYQTRNGSSSLKRRE